MNNKISFNETLGNDQRFIHLIDLIEGIREGK